MDCKIAREMMHEERRDRSVQAHLESCPACRAAAELDRRLAAAIASIPRVPAPRGLVGAVMAELRPSARGHRPNSPRPPWTLRPWEIGWLGAACLLLIALVPALSGGSIRPVVAPLSSWFSGVIAPLATASADLPAFRIGGLNLPAFLETARNLPTPAGLMTWLSGAAAFAFGFFLLLSWNGPARRTDEWEDAHA
jgi:hypothetical protein